jgi:hypothetical protein
MSTPFRFKNADNTTVDFEDYYVRADYFRSGNLWLWGQGSWGQRGDNTTVTHRSSPIQTVAYGTNWKQVDIGFGLSSAAIKTDGTLWTMGINNFGQLGDNTVINKSSPVQTVTFGTNWKQFVCGDSYVAAIKTDGTFWCWGYNNLGQLGDNTVTHRSSPVQTIAGGTDWKQIASGGNHTAAIKTDGTLWCWGANTSGQLGDNTITNRSSPVQTVTFAKNWKQVVCSGNHTAAIKTDGTLWAWGNNATYGQLGDNTTVSKSSPVQTVAFGTNWKSVSSGTHHCAAIKTDGTLWTWGRNSYGQLTVSTEPTPATSGDPGTSPVTVSGSKINGNTFNTSNTTGVSIGMNVYTSTQSVLWTTVSAISTNVSITFTPSSFTGTWTGTISLGVGAVKPSPEIAGVTNNRSSPIQTIAYGTNWKQVVCSSYGFTAAIKTDGTLWLWGRNSYGGLGDNTRTNRSSPVQTIMYGTNWKEVSAGTYTTAAIQYQDDYQ